MPRQLLLMPLALWCGAQLVVGGALAFVLLADAWDELFPAQGPPRLHPEHLQRLLDDCDAAGDLDRYTSPTSLCTARDSGFQLFLLGQTVGACWAGDEALAPMDRLPGVVGSTAITFLGTCEARQ